MKHQSPRFAIVMNTIGSSDDTKNAAYMFLVDFLEHKTKGSFFEMEALADDVQRVFVLREESDGYEFLEHLSDEGKHLKEIFHGSSFIDPISDTRSITCYNRQYGLHVYHRRGDDFRGKSYKYEKGKGVIHGWWSPNFAEGRYVGKVVRLWAVGQSNGARKVINTLRYEMAREKGKYSKPVLEDMLSVAVKRLGDNVTLSLITERGDLWTFNNERLRVNEFGTDEQAIRAAIFEWELVKIQLDDSELHKLPHNLSPWESALRQGAHQATMDRNARGFL